MKIKVQRSFNIAAAHFDEAAFLYREISDRMLTRLEYIKLQPQWIVDIGATTGYGLRLLKQRYPKSRLVGFDLAENMLHLAQQQRRWFARDYYVAADMDQLPLSSNTADIIFSSLVFQWSPQLQQTLQECYRILKPGGLLFFATYGPDTLQELRVAWQQCDNATHVHDFIDMHDIGDNLLRTGFHDPVVDMEILTCRYQSVNDLYRELRHTGSQNLTTTARASLTGKKRFQQMVKHYEQHRAAGKLPATFEIIYALAWKNSNPQLKSTATTEFQIPINSIIRRQK